MIPPTPTEHDGETEAPNSPRLEQEPDAGILDVGPLATPSKADTQDAQPLATAVPLPLLEDTQLQAACLPFLKWMCQPPLTPTEALVKARRVKTMSQLQPIKLNLRFIFALLLERQIIRVSELEALARLAVCQSFHEALAARGVGSGRIHALFLLIKKVLVYLTATESAQRHLYLLPSSHQSYMYVEQICSDSSFRRKQEARNHALLGHRATKLLLGAQSAAAAASASLPVDAFSIPSMYTSERGAPTAESATAGAAAGAAAVATAESGRRPVPSPSTSRISSPSSSQSEGSSPNELTPEELKRVARGSLAYLVQQETALFVAHLVTATLSLGLAPRSQVLKQLRVGSTLVKEADGRYWIKMLAEQNKNGKPTMFALPSVLTEPYDHYLAAIRPAVLRATQQEHDYVFCKKNGTAPRSEFSDLTCLATQQILGRPINAHAFRSAVITAFYESGATQSDMDVLANIMAHDAATARRHYFKPQMTKAALQANERMMSVLELTAAPALTMAPASMVVDAQAVALNATLATPPPAKGDAAQPCSETQF